MNDTIYFPRPMKFTASIFRHRTRPINILPPSIDRSIFILLANQPLSLHVCVRSCINFVVMIPTFFFGIVSPILENLEVIKHLIVFDSWYKGTLGGEFSITSIEFLNDFREDLREKGRYLRGKVFNDGRG